MTHGDVSTQFPFSGILSEMGYRRSFHKSYFANLTLLYDKGEGKIEKECYWSLGLVGVQFFTGSGVCSNLA
jgi:hypothetical protein